jgi:PTH1 family peptidyl-tRNA hydrolase
MAVFRRKPKEAIQPEWLVVGLGNPGGEYDGTRHNVGFEVIRELSERHRLKLDTRRLQAHFGVGRVQGVAVALAKPMTFMNLSGLATAALVRHFGLKPDRVVAVYDDMDLEVGRVHIRPKGGAGSHNGVKSLIQSLGTNEFPRIRIGIGSPGVTGVDHVLTRFTADELDLVLPAIRKAANGCELIATEGVDIAMNRINAPEE